MLFDTVKSVLEDIFTPDCDITMDTRFDDDLFADEMDFVELAWALEEELDIPKLEDDAFMAIETVGELMKRLEDELKKQ